TPHPHRGLTNWERVSPSPFKDAHTPKKRRMYDQAANASAAAPAYSEYDYQQAYSSQSSAQQHHQHDLMSSARSDAGGSAGGAHQHSTQQDQHQHDNTYSDYQSEYLQQHQGYADYAQQQQQQQAPAGYPQGLHPSGYGLHPHQHHEYAASHYGDAASIGGGGGAGDATSIYSGQNGWGYDPYQQQQQQAHSQLHPQHSGYSQAGGYLSPNNGWQDLQRMSSASGAGGPSSGMLMPGPGLTRTSTHLSMANSIASRAGPSAAASNASLAGGVGGGGASSLAAARRKSKETEPAQRLPFNKEFVDEYRARMKEDPDPEAQFAFAKYLIEAAKRIHDPRDGPKQARKYRDNLLSESLKLIKRLATTGMGLGKPPYAEAQFFLANCFGNGSLGLQVDHEKAYNLYVQASKQNHPAATYRTAVCNEVGAGTKRDHHRAVLFFRKASALGDTAGMYKLGMVLLNGLLGQPRNPREAIVWLKRAAGQADEDNPHALHELGLLYERAPALGASGPSSSSAAAGMSAAARAAEARAELAHAAGIAQDEAYARELYTQAAQLGYAPSQFKLGSAYEFGSLTCAVDPRRSIAWYTKAAQKGDGESELALSGWYLT
ncbi:hypothetical protein OC846_006849, partial [Tilletia horrida]